MFPKLNRKAVIALSSLGIGAACFNTNVRDSFSQPAIGAVRLGRTLFTVSRIVIDYEMIQFRNNSTYSENEQNALWSKVHTRSANRLLRLAELNGGCFVKVGQHIAALDYLVPREYVEILRVLHSQAPRSKFADVRHVIEKELRCKLEDVFDFFDEQPIASASLAQVHRAVLKREYFQNKTPNPAAGNTLVKEEEENERLVAVKVQHPNVRAYSEIDMRTMSALARIVAFMIPQFKIDWLVKETQKNLPVELDFSVEAANCERSRQTYAYLRYVRVPKVHSKVSTSRLLVMEYLNGVQIDDTRKLRELGIPTYRVVERLSQLYAEMIFKHGFVHCDPHPGNMLVVPVYSNKAKKRSATDVELILLDHGLYQSLSKEFISLYSLTWHALLTGDEKKIRRCASRMNCDEFFGLLACIISGRSWKSVQSGIMRSQIDSAEQDEIRDEASRYLPQITEVLDRVPRELLLLLKTNDLLRGVEQKLYGRKLEGALAFEEASQQRAAGVLQTSQQVKCHRQSRPERAR